MATVVHKWATRGQRAYRLAGKVALPMSRDDVLAVLAAYQAAGARCVEYQLHIDGRIHADSPWALRSWDRFGRSVETSDRVSALNWLIRYWIAGSIGPLDGDPATAEELLALESVHTWTRKNTSGIC